MINHHHHSHIKKSRRPFGSNNRDAKARPNDNGSPNVEDASCVRICCSFAPILLWDRRSDAKDMKSPSKQMVALFSTQKVSGPTYQTSQNEDFGTRIPFRLFSWCLDNRAPIKSISTVSLEGGVTAISPSVPCRFAIHQVVWGTTVSVWKKIRFFQGDPDVSLLLKAFPAPSLAAHWLVRLNSNASAGHKNQSYPFRTESSAVEILLRAGLFVQDIVPSPKTAVAYRVQ